MGTWYLGISVGLFLVLIGLYTHWIVILIGAALPVIPVLTWLLRRGRPPGRPAEPGPGPDESG